jgi:hypothetical protein
MSDEYEKRAPELKMSYFDLKEATNDIGNALGAKETAIASAKLFGKTIFNTALFAGRAAIKTSEDFSELKEKHAESSDEKLKSLQKKGNSLERIVASAILKERDSNDQSHKEH